MVEKILKTLGDKLDGQEIRELLDCHLQNSAKTPIFQKALGNFINDGSFTFAATWSWWAFLAGPFWFFYRKLYMSGLILLIASVILGILDLFYLNLALSVAAGLGAKYLYTRKFLGDLEASGYPDEPWEDVRSRLRSSGGCNNWAIVAFILLVVGIATLIALVTLGFVLIPELQDLLQ